MAGADGWGPPAGATECTSSEAAQIAGASRATGFACARYDRQMDGRLPGTVDSVAFCRGRKELEGTVDAEQLPRLAEAGATADGPIEWAVRGSTGRDELDRLREYLTVEVGFRPVIPCARCLGPVTLPRMDVANRFRFAASEEQAAREDREAQDCDVIAQDPRLDLNTLIEDEVLLALPMLATHEICPDQL